MNLLKEVGNALITVIQWIGIIYSGFCDWFGISEWTMLFISIGVIGSLIGIGLYRRNK